MTHNEVNRPSIHFRLPACRSYRYWRFFAVLDNLLRPNAELTFGIVSMPTSLLLNDQMMFCHIQMLAPRDMPVTKQWSQEGLVVMSKVISKEASLDRHPNVRSEIVF